MSHCGGQAELERLLRAARSSTDRTRVPESHRRFERMVSDARVATSGGGDELARRRVWRRLHTTRPRRLVVLRPHGIVVASLLFLSGGVAGAVGIRFWGSSVTRVEEPRPAAAEASPRRRHVARTSSPDIAVAPVSPPARGEPLGPEVPSLVAKAAVRTEPSRHAHPRRVVARVEARPVPTPTPSPPAESPALVPVPVALPTEAEAEAASLAFALGVLRQKQDAQGARILLEEHNRRWPRGVLAAESRRALLEALLSLGRGDDALRLLESVPELMGSTRPELAVVRGELRTALGRCAEALSDFRRITMPGTRPSPLLERALYGTAVCHERMGEPGTAREAWARYVELFPGGRFADVARRALSR